MTKVELSVCSTVGHWALIGCDNVLVKFVSFICKQIAVVEMDITMLVDLRMFDNCRIVTASCVASENVDDPPIPIADCLPVLVSSQISES